MRRGFMVTAATAAAAVVMWCTGAADAATGWAIQATPNPAGTTASELTAVSCVSPASCTAVGYSDVGALAEYWNGSTWAIQATPDPAGSELPQLNGVSCVSSASCMAVGYYFEESKPFIQHPLAEYWNGSTWALQTLAADHADRTSLTGVSCSTATSCTTVGFSQANDHEPSSAVAEHWNGRRWAAQAVPTPAGSLDATLFGVSCRTATRCTAVGFSDSNALAEAWNGSSWAVQTAANSGSAENVLTGISCHTATSCTAVGYSSDGTLAEAWNGSTWAVQATPDPASGTGVLLNGISCASAANCTAIGSYESATGRSFRSLAEHWNGSTWGIQATPRPAGADKNPLRAVSCALPGSCTAVGWAQIPRKPITTLAEAN
jgi:hypothetical protein